MWSWDVEVGVGVGVGVKNAERIGNMTGVVNVCGRGVQGCVWVWVRVWVWVCVCVCVSEREREKERERERSIERNGGSNMGSDFQEL